MVVLLPAIAFAQDFPALPPLPPLPGMEAPAPAEPMETPSVASPAPAPKDKVEIAAPPAIPEAQKEDVARNAAPVPAAQEDEFAMPDFGLFDPSELADVKTPAEPVESDVALPEPVLPAQNEPAMASDDSLSIPALPDLPSFDELTDPALTNGKGTNKAEQEIPPLPGDFEDIFAPKPAPELAREEQNPEPKEQTVANNIDDLTDRAPAWSEKGIVPKAKPSSLGAEVRVTKSEEDDTGTSEPSLASLIDKELRGGGEYVPSSEAAALEDKKVVWPENFKTQKLPPKIYKKQYNSANRHLPHAVYQKEIESHLFKAVAANDLDAIRALLRTGVPLSITNAVEDDLLMHAVKSHADASLQLLLGLGMKPNHKDRYGTTPLHRAVVAGRQDLVTILMRAGADPNAADVQGITPLSIASMRGDQAMLGLMNQYAHAQNRYSSAAHYQPY